MPEARIILSQTVIYLSCSLKSNSVYLAIDSAIASVKEKGALGVPLHLRNAPSKLMKDLGYEKEYDYAHNYENNFVAQEYLPKEIEQSLFYNPTNNPKEYRFLEFLQKRWKNKYYK